VPVYALTRARHDQFGPSFNPSKYDCERWNGSRNADVDEFDLSSPRSRAGEPTDADGQSWCAGTQGILSRDGITLRYAGDIAALIRRTQVYADRLIVDQTGLAGRFEWTVTFLPALVQRLFPDSNVDIFTAFNEQLGLKLEPRVAPVDMVVIDSVSMPTPN
jgi:uncharacterized protein (TIGR03435 family)